MSTSILVAYATRYGSTQEVAEAIAAVLHEGGCEVDIQPVRSVQVLDKYDGVVLGAPLYIGKWRKGAHDFLVQHQEALAQHPVAVFALGPVGTSEQEMTGSRDQFDKELGKYSWLNPVARETFVGKYDPAKLGFLHKLLALLPASPLHGLQASDNRDWNAIRSWAGSLSEKFQG
jgi:menaquinone-dependent protoporphyrinogen oxidase